MYAALERAFETRYRPELEELSAARADNQAEREEALRALDDAGAELTELQARIASLEDQLSQARQREAVQAELHRRRVIELSNRRPKRGVCWIPELRASAKRVTAAMPRRSVSKISVVHSNWSGSLGWSWLPSSKRSCRLSLDGTRDNTKLPSGTRSQAPLPTAPSSC
jgi:hypothetical protein